MSSNITELTKKYFNKISTDTVEFNPATDTPAASVFSNGSNSFTVCVLCYIPVGTLKKHTAEYFNNIEYPLGEGKVKATETIALNESKGKASVVLSYFQDIAASSLSNNSGATVGFSSRTFGVCYDFEVAEDTAYTCDVYALKFNYSVKPGEGVETVLMIQGDVDPELSRGTVSAPATGGQ